MSFWGKLGGALKGIGKVALKAAPVAAAFIPGVGPLAAMGIGAATNAASKKLSGGSWGDALKSGAVGGAMGALGGAAKSSGLIGKLGSRLGIGSAKSLVQNRIQGGADQMRQQVMGPSNFQRVLGGMSRFGQNSRQPFNPTMLPCAQRTNRPVHTQMQPRAQYGPIGPSQGIQDPRRYGGTPLPNVMY